MSKSITISCFFFFFPIFSFGQINSSGSITSYVDSLITSIPDVIPANVYQSPTVSQRAVWESIIDKLLDGDYSGAQADAQAIDYDVVQFNDTSNSKTYYMLRKKSSGSNYWGTFIINPDPLRSRVFIQIPHPLFDTNSGNQGIVVFKNTAARAFILAGTHRCNSTSFSLCDGTTTVCSGSSEPFRKSDQAHNDDGPFQITTDIFKQSVPNLIVVQLHGFVKDPGYPDLILGNGTQSLPATDWLLILKNNLSLLDGSLQFKIAHIDTDWTTLTGTTNSQGRLINNSPDPCGISPSNPTGRFLHVEQAYIGLRDNAASYAKVATAIGNTFPPDKVIASAATGIWENSSTWTGGIVPNDTTHVIISSGHTVTVTTNSAEAHSIGFSDNTAALSFAAGSNLSVYGDFVLASEIHNAFSSWATEATVTFAGADDQVLSGWNRDSTNFSSTLIEVVIDKSSGKIVTAGNDMNLNLGTRLEIVNGTFELTAGDDIEGRDLTGAGASAPMITIHQNGVFTIQGDSSYIRSGIADTIPIGPINNCGMMKFTGTDLSLGYNFLHITNESGATMAVFPGWKSSRLLRVDTLLINAGSFFETSTTTNVISSNGRTVLNAGGIYRVLGSAVNFSSQFTNNGTIEYLSAAAQTVNDRSYKKLLLGNGGEKIWTVTSNRSLDTLELNGTASLNITSAGVKTVTVNKQMIMNGGNITTNSDTLILGQNTSSAGTLSRSSGSVVGHLKRWVPAGIDDFLFPVGIADQYRPVDISVTSLPDSGGSLTASFIESNPGETGLPLDDGGIPIINISTEGYWSISSADGFNGGIFSLDLSPKAFSGIADVSSLRVVTRPISGSWQLQGTHVSGTGTIAAPVVSRSGLSGFGEFAIAGGADNALPVNIASFTAAPNQLNAELKWKTVTESNNHGFEIERHSAENRSFEWHKVGFVEGKGTTNEPKEYSFADMNLHTGKYFYRLKQIDRDGRFSYSHLLQVTIHDVPKVFALEQNYPNPFNPTTVIGYQLPVNSYVTLKVFDVIGREVVTLVNEVKEAGRYSVPFDGTKLSSGMYFARLQSGDKLQLKKMMLLK
ncbi:MAG: T9SS type A sorting domain-containing protein [Bacteroidota bacterium]